MPRRLTESEEEILLIVQGYYGSWNSVDEIVFSEQEDALIFVKDAAGEAALCVNLTVCASVYRGRSLSLKQLKEDWLQIPGDA
ncbi:MAG TPA: hypothetical protein VLM40_03670 [Gemmata sp.]|nr:hypothetical protein [Gemmata sp.]